MTTTTLDRQQTVANLVLEHSACAEVLQRHHIDYCCKGNVSIEAAAQAKGVETGVLMRELAQAIDSRRAEPFGARELSTPRLIDHIVSTHHAFLRKALPFIQALATKVSRVHGDRNAKLAQLADAVDELSGVLIPHLDDEEQTLFLALMDAQAQPRAQWELVVAMEEEHRGVAQLLERIRSLGDDFVAPEWACNSYRTLLLELAELERDVHVHVHLENHLLKPRFALREDAVQVA